MKTERNILIAFILNLAFSIFEFFGGIFTGSVAIISDAIHDIGDAISIGVSYFLEKKSKRQPDDKYTYGYSRYSVLGGLITTIILLVSSILVIYNAVIRLFNPVEINYNGMILFAIIGVAVNFLAAIATKDGHSINQKAVNLHMLEDVLGWIIVLIGAVIIKFTSLSIIDPIMSICVALFIFGSASKNLIEVINLFLEKTPGSINIEELKHHILNIEGVEDVHHVHVWTLDGHNIYATLHIISNSNAQKIKHKIREELEEHGIMHSTLEIETTDEDCHHKECKVNFEHSYCGHHHHHH